MGEHGGASREHEGTRGSTEAAEKEHEAVQGRSRWEPEVDFLHLGLSCILLPQGVSFYAEFNVDAI